MKRSRSRAGFCDHSELAQCVTLPACKWMELLEKLLTQGQAHGGINALADTLHCISCDAIAAVSNGKLSCGHALAADVQRLELYCLHCEDYVYLKQFDEAVVLLSQRSFQQKQQHANASNRLPETDPGPDLQAKRQKVQLAAPATYAEAPAGTGPQQEQQEQQQRNPRICSLTATTAPAGADKLAALSSLDGAWEPMTAPDGFPLGLRGLNNLGNTCFMNSVLQVLFHAPLLPAFYLGEGHDPTTCRLTARDKPCLSCQLECVFGEVYSGNRQPFSPAEFLYQWWRFADSLAGYQQQDAHEFYLSLLEGLSGSLVPLPALDVPATDATVGEQQRPAAAAAAAAADQPAEGEQAVANDQAQQEQQQQQQRGLPLPGDCAVPLQPPQQQQHPAFPEGQMEFLQQHPFPAGPPGVAAAGMPLFHFDVLGNPVPYSGVHGWQQYDSQQQQQPQQQQLLGLGGGELSGYETPISSAGTPEPNWDGEGASKTQGASTGLVELLFSGLLRSDVRCCACGHTSTAHDPFRDISLDLHLPRPPKLPPSEPHNRPPVIHNTAATSALSAPAAAGLQSPGVQPGVFAAGAAGADVGAAAVAGAAVGGGGQGVREPTPPLMLLTPSPTPHPSDLLADFLDDTDDAAGGQAGLSGLCLGTHSLATSASGLNRPASCTQPGGELTGTTEASPDIDGEEVECRHSVVPQTAPLTSATGPKAAGGKAGRSRLAVVAGVCTASNPAGLPAPPGKAVLAADCDAAMSTETSVTPEALPVGGIVQTQQSYKREATPELSELGGPAASQSSQQVGGGTGATAAAAGSAREGTPELGMLGMQDGAAGEAIAQTGAAVQQQCVSGREATPQSQQPGPYMAQQELRQEQLQKRPGAAGADSEALPGTSAVAAGGTGGVASSLVRGMSGSLGQLVRAPVAAIKQLLPGWTCNSHEQQQQQQQQLAPAAATRDDAAAGVLSQPVEGDGESMANIRSDSAAHATTAQRSPSQPIHHGVDTGWQQQQHVRQPMQGEWGGVAGQQLSQGQSRWQEQQALHGVLPDACPLPMQQQCQQHIHPNSSVPSVLPAGFQNASAGAAGCGAYAVGSDGAGSQTAAGGRAGAKAATAAKLPRQTRCGKCKYCLNKHLKKGCEANKKLRDEQKHAAMLGREQQRAAAAAATAAAAAAAAGVVADPAAAAAAAAPAVPFGDILSAATQPTHPLAGVAATPQPPLQHLQQQRQHVLPDQQQQYAFHDQLLPQQQQPSMDAQQDQYQQHYGQDWMLYYQHHADQGPSDQGPMHDMFQQQQAMDSYQQQERYGLYPHQAGSFYPQQQLLQPQKPRQQQKKQQPAAAKQQKKLPQQKQRVSPKPPAGSMAQDVFTSAALEQGLMQRRDEKGRFFNKENMAAWARQLHSEGYLTGVPGAPDATLEEVAAAKALGRELPPAYLAAQAAKQMAAAAAAGISLPPKGVAAGAAKAGGKGAATKKTSIGSAATGTGKKHAQPPPPVLRMNELSLAGCLRRFVRPERLGPGAHWHCSACGSSQAALKQMSIRRLPLVLCFHVKRFEHGGRHASAQEARRADEVPSARVGYGSLHYLRCAARQGRRQQMLCCCCY